MKESQILRKVYKLIEKEDETYICFAVKIVTKNEDEEKGKKITKFIHSLLGTENELYSYEDWLVDNGFCEDYFDTKNNYEKVKQGRLNWIKWMIEQYEKQGR